MLLPSLCWLPGSQIQKAEEWAEAEKRRQRKERQRQRRAQVRCGCGTWFAGVAQAAVRADTHSAACGQSMDHLRSSRKMEISVSRLGSKGIASNTAGLFLFFRQQCQRLSSSMGKGHHATVYQRMRCSPLIAIQDAGLTAV